MDYIKELSRAISDASGITVDETLPLVEVPSDTSLGDFAFPCFKLAKNLRKAPYAIAAELSKKIKPPGFISDIKVVGAYINFFVDRQSFIENTLLEIQKQGESFGGSDEGKRRSKDQIPRPYTRRDDRQMQTGGT